MLIKFEENISWWVDWLGQLTWNDLIIRIIYRLVTFVSSDEN